MRGSALFLGLNADDADADAPHPAALDARADDAPDADAPVLLAPAANASSWSATAAHPSSPVAGTDTRSRRQVARCKQSNECGAGAPIRTRSSMWPSEA
jgi:hypothetical protein